MNAKNQLKLYNSSSSSIQKKNTNKKFYKIKYVYIKNINDKKKYLNTIYRHNKTLNSTDIKSNSITNAETTININPKLNKKLINNLTTGQKTNKKNKKKILSEEEFNNNLKIMQFTPKTSHKNSEHKLREEYLNTQNNSLEDKNIYISYNEEDLIKKLSSMKLDKYYISNKTKVNLTELCGSEHKGNTSQDLRLVKIRNFDGGLDCNFTKSKIKIYKTLSNSVKNNTLNKNKQKISKLIFNCNNNINNYQSKNENNDLNLIHVPKIQSHKTNVPFYKITNIYSSDTNQNIVLNDFNKVNKSKTLVENQKKNNKNNNVCEEVAQKRPGRHTNMKNKIENEELNDEEENNNQNDTKTFSNNNNIFYRKLETFTTSNSKILNKKDSNMNKTNIKNKINKNSKRKSTSNEYTDILKKCKINKYLTILKKIQNSKKLNIISKTTINTTSRKKLDQKSKPKQNTININIHNCNNDNYNCFLINIDKDEKTDNLKKTEITGFSENSSKSKSCKKEKRKHNNSNKEYHQTNIRQKKIHQHIYLEPNLLKSPFTQIPKIFKQKSKLNPLKMGLLNNGIKNSEYSDKLNDELFSINCQTDENGISNINNTNYYTIEQNKKTNDFLQKKIKDILLKNVMKTENGKKTKNRRLGNMVFIDFKRKKKNNSVLNNTDNK